MIIASTHDYRQVAKKRLPPFLFEYIEGGAYDEQTLHANRDDLAKLKLCQRVMQDMSALQLGMQLFDEPLALPAVLAPVGLTGMYARRGEVQAAKAATKKGIPFTLSSVSVCPIEEVTSQITRPMWFQLYVLKDRGFMQNVLERAMAHGCNTLVFTVDMPLSGARYRDAHSGLMGKNAALKRYLQSCLHLRWALDVGLLGRPHDLGNITHYFGKNIGLQEYRNWVGANFDPSVSWQDLEWIRRVWDGKLILKGILDPSDAVTAARFGADGIVVSNHGGRQLDSVPSTVQALPPIVEAVKTFNENTKILVDSGIRTGIDLFKMLALGADACMLGRAYIYALAAQGEQGVFDLLTLIESELRVAMALTGVNNVNQINSACLTNYQKFIQPL